MTSIPTTPTWDAYEAACAAIEKHRARADAAEATVNRIRAIVEQREADTLPGNMSAPIPVAWLRKALDERAQR